MAATADRLVIFGATGDLARRMLLPSLYFLERDGLLDPKLRIIGSARSALDDEKFRAIAYDSIAERKNEVDQNVWRRLAERFSYCRADAKKPSDYADLGRMTGDANVYYLSVSPQHYRAICSNIEAAGLATPQSRIVVEK